MRRHVLPTWVLAVALLVAAPLNSDAGPRGPEPNPATERLVGPRLHGHLLLVHGADGASSIVVFFGTCRGQQTVFASTSFSFDLAVTVSDHLSRYRVDNVVAPPCYPTPVSLVVDGVTSWTPISHNGTVTAILAEVLVKRVVPRR